MSGGAWFWLIVVILVTWALPIGLFFYNPKQKDLGSDEWQPIPYDHLRFKKDKEMIVLGSVCVLFSWVIWMSIK